MFYSFMYYITLSNLSIYSILCFIVTLIPSISSFLCIGTSSKVQVVMIDTVILCGITHYNSNDEQPRGKINKFTLFTQTMTLPGNHGFLFHFMLGLQITTKHNCATSYCTYTCILIFKCAGL